MTIAAPHCSCDLWLGGTCPVHGSRYTRDELVSLRGSVSALAAERDRLRAALQRIAAAPEEDGRKLAAIAADAIAAPRP